jgi:hypothetical protein
MDTRIKSNLFSQKFNEVYKETQDPKTLDQVFRMILPVSDQDEI